MIGVVINFDTSTFGDLSSLYQFTSDSVSEPFCSLVVLLPILLLRYCSLHDDSN